MKRSIVFGIILLLLLLIQASPLYDAIRISIGAKPDLTLLVIVYLSLALGSFEGLIYGFSAGLAQDIISSGVLGLNALVFLNIGFFSGITKRRLSRSPLSFISLVLIGTLFKTIVYVAVNSMTYESSVTLAYLKNQLLIEMPLNLLLAPMMYFALDRVSVLVAVRHED